MKQSEIEEKIIDETSDWNIIREIVNKIKQDEQAEIQRQKQWEEEREKRRKKAEERLYNRSNYYYESPRERGLRMRRHNETVASMGYGSSYF